MNNTINDLVNSSNSIPASSGILIRWFWDNYFRKYVFLLIIGVVFMTLEGGMLGLLSYSIKSMFDEVFIPSNQAALLSVGFIIFGIRFCSGIFVLICFFIHLSIFIIRHYILLKDKLFKNFLYLFK